MFTPSRIPSPLGPLCRRLVSFVLLLLPLAGAPVAGAATLPAGFSETRLASGLASPTAMAIAPDGRIFVCEQSGRLRVIKNGALLPTPFLTVTVSSVGERGLLGVAFDPDFATNRFVYVYYTATSPAIHNRISRFTASATNPDVVTAGSEVQIFNLPNLSAATNHNGGAIHFGPDGMLYAAVGDNANGANAPSLNTTLGKILRINKDGTIPSDNPFFTQTTGNNRAIWARGVRNPFTFAFQPGTGRMHINDVGENTWALSDGYLRTMSVELLSGRDFTEQDSVSSRRIALVNPSFTRRLGIVGDPVGAKFRVEGPSPAGTMYEIVGLVADTKYFALREEFLPIVFVPIAQIEDPRPFTDVVIRSSLPLAGISSAVRGSLQKIDSSIGVEVRTFDSTIRQGLARERLMAAISAFFGVVAVLIAAIGLYGTISEMVTRRRGEIGVRIALGAGRGGIVTMVLRDAATLLLIGLGVGAAVSLVAAGLVQSVVFGVDPHDLRPIGLACACLAAVTLGAALVPACRAAMLEPLAALREG